MNTTINLRINKEVKASAQEVAESAGLTLSALINAYLHQVAATRHIEIFSPEPMTPHLESLIAEVEQELKTEKTAGPFDTADDFLESLNS